MIFERFRSVIKQEAVKGLSVNESSSLLYLFDIERCSLHLNIKAKFSTVQFKLYTIGTLIVKNDSCNLKVDKSCTSD